MNLPRATYSETLRDIIIGNNIIAIPANIREMPIADFVKFIDEFREMLIKNIECAQKLIKILIHFSRMDLILYSKNNIEPEFINYIIITCIKEIVGNELKKHPLDNMFTNEQLEIMQSRTNVEIFPIYNILELIDMTNNYHMCYNNTILENEEMWNVRKQLTYEKNCITDYCKKMGRKEYLTYFMLRSCTNNENSGVFENFDRNIFMHIVSFL